MEAQLKRSDITRYKRVDGVIGKLAIESKEVQDMMAPGINSIFSPFKKIRCFRNGKITIEIRSRSTQYWFSWLLHCTFKCLVISI
jgi:hypothetical protein